MGSRRLPEKLYRIGEIIDHTGLSRQTLHFYATIGLIREKSRTRAGYRLFAPTVFADLERVQSLQKKGLTLREIREVLESKHASRRPAAKTTRKKRQQESKDPDSGPRADRPPRHAFSGGKA